MSQFKDFGLSEPLDSVLSQMGFNKPTPVQSQAIPLVLAGKDVLVTAQTGTGKTAAFAVPLLSKMLGGWNKTVLIVAPTRELAEQIGAVLIELTAQTPHLRSAVVIGGAAYHRQIKALRSQPAFVVGTPGRLIDQARLGHLDLKNCGGLVIDEADRLLDMGFEPQMIELVAHLPKDRQSLLFSATLPNEIISLASRFLRQPVRVTVGAVSKPVDKIAQDVIRLRTVDKDQTLIREIDKVTGSVIIFTKTKWKTEKLAAFLQGAGHEVARIHGDRSQAQRSAALNEFREGKVRILVATDIAARGIDVSHIQHVINYDLPTCPEDYIHRIGRTARNGNEGHSIAFVTPEESMRWAQIYKLIYGKYPDEYPKKGGGMSGRKAPLAGRSTEPQGRGRRGESPRSVGGSREPQRNDKYADKRGASPSAGGGGGSLPRIREVKPMVTGNGRRARRDSEEMHAISPRRESALLAERFLKDERRKSLAPRPSNATNTRPAARAPEQTGKRSFTQKPAAKTRAPQPSRFR